jgi:outer membrane protein assembly factor BamB
MRGGARRVSGALVVALVLVGCSSDKLPDLDQALENQPAELVESGDSFVIGDAEGGCGFPRETQLVLLDGETGATRWTRDVPWAPFAPIVLQDVAVSVSRTIDGNPPSLAALDLASGAPVWQRFIASDSLEPAGTVDGAAQVVGTDQLVVVDAEGAIVHEQQLAPPVRVQQRSGSTTDYVVLDSMAPVWPDPPALGYTRERIAAIGDRVIAAAAADRVAAFDDAGRELWMSEPITLDDEYSSISELRADEESVVVLVGSDVGPNRRLVVLDPSTGAQRWSIDGIREVALAGEFMLYDLRVGSSPEEPTRETVLVDSASGDERWRVSSSGTLGGYVGTVGPDLVFADRGDSLPLVVPVEGPDPGSVLLGDEHVRGTYLLSDSGIVRGSNARVSSFDDGGSEVWTSNIEEEVRTLTATEAGLLVSVGDADYGCE